MKRKIEFLSSSYIILNYFKRLIYVIIKVYYQLIIFRKKIDEKISIKY